MNVKHTPGPWTAERDRFGTWEIGTDDADIASVNGFGGDADGESDANASLIAAAPDLLEALIECLNCEFAVTEKTAVAKAESAIAKAMGGE